MTKDNVGRSGADAPSGLRPFGAEPQDASQAKPLVPNATTLSARSIARDLRDHRNEPETAGIIECLCGKIDALEAEMERRDLNETRNCLNWGPCSRHDGRMDGE